MRVRMYMCPRRMSLISLECNYKGNEYPKYLSLREFIAGSGSAATPGFSGLRRWDKGAALSRVLGLEGPAASL